MTSKQNKGEKKMKKLNIGYNGIGQPIVTYNNKLYYVKFIHDQNNKSIKNGHPTFGRTKAYITDDEGKILIYAYAYCSASENYSKRGGRAAATGHLQSSILKQQLKGEKETKWQE